MAPTQTRPIFCLLLAGCFALSSGLLGRDARPVSSSLTAHEWGTFTSIAGDNGQAVDWSPLTGSTDLPSFVEHFRNAGFKFGLRGTVRMETPVLYFYDSQEETVSVKVSFYKGLITEWYPRASRVEPSTSLNDVSPYSKQADGSIAWNSVTITPNLRANFPADTSYNLYYAARQTSSTPLLVKTSAGDQQEKFLFYRGVSSFAPPISASVTPKGPLLVQNHGDEAIPNVILFERRGDKVGFRIAGALQSQALLDSPPLTDSVDSLGRDLEGLLVTQGLYQDEAHAMVETWGTSWFEEGTRLLYIVPTSFVNSVVPLSIGPAPSQTVRVFVGRLEIVTPATERSVDRALATHDTVTLSKYGRFLEPILEEMLKKERDAAKLRLLQEALNSVYGAKVARNHLGN
jgi:hypothetical protein